MTQKIQTGLLYGAVASLILAISYLFGIHSLIAKAASLVFKTDCVTASATSTLAYMTPGTATTTLTCGMGNDGANTAVLAIQVNASSTNTVYDIFVEESMDGQDWYPIPSFQSASTSKQFSLAVRPFATFGFASSTIGGVKGLNGASTTAQSFTATNNRNHYELEVPVRMKWVRSYATLETLLWDGTATSTAGAIWMQIIPKISI